LLEQRDQFVFRQELPSHHREHKPTVVPDVLFSSSAFRRWAIMPFFCNSSRAIVVS
jgi:hypothetical protein